MKTIQIFGTGKLVIAFIMHTQYSTHPTQAPLACEKIAWKVVKKVVKIYSALKAISTSYRRTNQGSKSPWYQKPHAGWIC
jgi:hypothetical protein